MARVKKSAVAAHVKRPYATYCTATLTPRLVPIFIDDTNIKIINEKREKGLRE